MGKQRKWFVRRHPDKEPPSYYLEYGDKYAHVFSDEVRGKLSDKGKQWVDDTRRILQEKMEEGIASGKMDELDPEKFEEIAFDMHSDAYEEAGISELPYEDLRHVVSAVKSKDMFTRKAIVESAEMVDDIGLVNTGKLAYEVGWGKAKEFFEDY